MTFPQCFVIYELNPQPWSASMHVKRGPLLAYQQALKEELAAQGATLWPVGASISLRLQFWRQLESEIDYDRRRHVMKYADATNLQKATEDALQGVLFGNDRYVKEILSRIEEQGVDVKPKVIITISSAE
jgi:hypothetical protein